MDTYKAPSTHIGRVFLKRENFSSGFRLCSLSIEKLLRRQENHTAKASVYTHERL